MNQFTISLQGLWIAFVGFLPRLLGAILLLLLAWIIATLVKKGIVRGLKALNFDQKLAKWRVANAQEDGNRMIESLGQIFYYLIWLFFIPGILAQIGLANIANPITNMFDGFLAFLPKLFGAIIILAVGYFVAKFVKELIRNILETVNIDRLTKKYMGKTGQTSAANLESNRYTLARVLSNVVFVIILIPVITMALETLEVKSISEPIVNVLNQVLAAIPNVLVAIILVIAGGLIAKLLGDLLEGLLASSGIDKYMRYLTSSTTQLKLSTVITRVVQTVLMVFFLVEALNVLNLEILNTIGMAVISYLPSILIAVVILGLGIFGGNALASFIKDSTGNRMTGEIVKYIIYILAIFMTLDQLQFASTIVNTAFLFVVGGLSVAFALAFGLGGRDFAKRQLDRFDEKMNEEANTSLPKSTATENDNKLDSY